MSQLFENLVDELVKRFPGRGLRLESEAKRRAVFPAAHPDVGDIIILDDDEELMVVYGNFTHCHYGAWRLPPGATNRDIVESLLRDLDDLFGDRLVMWGSHNEEGGIFRLGQELSSLSPLEKRRYVWSGPL